MLALDVDHAMLLRYRLREGTATVTEVDHEGDAAFTFLVDDELSAGPEGTDPPSADGPAAGAPGDGTVILESDVEQQATDELEQAVGRRRWFTGYLETVLDREVATAADIRHRETLEAMMRLLASTTAQELVMTNLARRLGVGRDLTERYEPWLERVFLVDRVPGWGRGLTSKLVRRPKIYAVDTGLAAALIGRDATALAQPTEPFAGPLIETLAASEIRRQLTWSLTEAHLHHLRDSDGSEVDLVIDSVDGRVAGVEVKATTAARVEDFKGLVWLRDRLDRAGVPFVAGIVLHTGVRRLPFGDRLVALPLSDLWS